MLICQRSAGQYSDRFLFFFISPHINKETLLQMQIEHYFNEEASDEKKKNNAHKMKRGGR